MLKKRIITALWGIPLVIVAIWLGEPWFSLLVAIWGLLAVLEFYRLVAAAKVPPLIYFGLIGTLVFILSPHFVSYGITLPVMLTSLIVLSLVWLVLRPQKEQAFASWVWTMAGMLYVGWLLSYFIALRGLDDGRDWVFLALFTTFGSDSSAFFVGRVLGKHRLAPHISPGKTWEGAIAGVFSAIISSLFLVNLLSLPLGYGGAMLLGLLVSVFSQLGDLVESLLKRNMGVKDSGKLISGHGGFLDRIDSVVFAGVVVYYYVLSFNNGWLQWLP